MDTETQIGRHERRHAIKEQIVKFGSGLTSDLNGVLESGCVHHCHASAPHSDHHPLLVNDMVSNVFCSTSCALGEPVAGLALAERFTESTERLPAILRRRGSTKDSAPILAGSSCTQTISRAAA